MVLRADRVVLLGLSRALSGFRCGRGGGWPAPHRSRHLQRMPRLPSGLPGADQRHPPGVPPILIERRADSLSFRRPRMVRHARVPAGRVRSLGADLHGRRAPCFPTRTFVPRVIVPPGSPDARSLRTPRRTLLPIEGRRQWPGHALRLGGFRTTPSRAGSPGPEVPPTVMGACGQFHQGRFACPSRHRARAVPSR